MRGAIVVLGVLAVVACNDAGLTQGNNPIAVPTSSSSSSGGPDGGASGKDGGDTEPPPTPEGWGDPKTTRRPGLLRVAQLNTRRFFDTVCQSGTCSSNGFEAVVTQEAFDRKVATLADGIASLGADVVTLSEVENKTCLDALQAKLEEAGFPFPVAHIAETGAAGSIDVGVLARGELGEVKNYRRDTPLKRPDGSNTTFTRELPEVHLTLGDSEVIVYAAHFRSKSDDDPGRRLAEAQATHDIMKATGDANKGALVVLGGDLNDTPGSEPIAALEAGLLRVASDLPENEQGTYRYQGQDQAIDHIFVTKNRAKSYVAQSATVVRDPGRAGFASSDHASLWADFKLP
ncbi:MAG: endonuclease/exonuclease/phosphatase family protein [Labilithrix sp.]|nr:endonuclease/exonuclease/phosphatase family protein [Labilithrix sp.]MCW5816143.1 endonuclease/exonuclease/phosphatase family protein [Labilithrix sp.]